MTSLGGRRAQPWTTTTVFSAGDRLGVWRQRKIIFSPFLNHLFLLSALHERDHERVEAKDDITALFFFHSLSLSHSGLEYESAQILQINALWFIISITNLRIIAFEIQLNPAITDGKGVSNYTSLLKLCNSEHVLIVLYDVLSCLFTST